MELASEDVTSQRHTLLIMLPQSAMPRTSLCAAGVSSGGHHGVWERLRGCLPWAEAGAVGLYTSAGMLIMQGPVCYTRRSEAAH